MNPLEPFRARPPRRPGAAAALALWAALAAPAAAAPATEPTASGSGLRFSGGGFYALVAAQSLRTRIEDKEYRLRCDCFIAEFSQGGVHEDGRIGWLADSKLGLQGQVATADGRWSVTGQVVARGARDGRVNLEWLYATHELGRGWTLQAGRQRLPLLSMSATQDVGLALPWVRLPTQLYGWDIVNYNGLNAHWRGTLGALAVLAKFYAGRETVKDSPFHALYYTDGTRTDTRWTGIRGLEVELRWSELMLRGAVVGARSSLRQIYPEYPDEPQGFWTDAVPLRISTVTFSAEPGPWLLRAEYFYGDRQQEWGTDKGWVLAAGRRFGDLQLVLSRSQFRQRPIEPTTYLEHNSMNTVVLRWDARPGLAWKLQLDDYKDESPGIAQGSRRLLSLALTGTF